MLSIKRRTRDRAQQGQSLVEFALAIPFLMLALIAIIYFGKLFFTKQVVCFAAQEGARAASRLPDLSNSYTLDRIRGFDDGGDVVGPDDDSNPSPVYRALSAGRLLSGSDGMRGSLPEGARIVIDGASPGSSSITVTVEYPFGLFFDPKSGGSNGDITEVDIAMTADASGQTVRFSDFLLKESASATQEVYQQ